MLQTNMQPYASDALEDAMRLAQTKAINSYSFSDCLNYLNYTWNDIFQKIIQQDEGYYSKTVKLCSDKTTLPPFVKNTIRVYSARDPSGWSRQIFRESGYNDLYSPDTYHISGFDLYCPSVRYKHVWLNYVPMQPQIFFTKNNRDPKLYKYEEFVAPPQSMIFNLYTLVYANGKYEMVHRNTTIGAETRDITDILIKEFWTIKYLHCDFPYVFVSYQNDITEEWYSGFYSNILTHPEWVEFNPFAYTGRNSNVEYLKTAWNDKSGMGVVVKDWNDMFMWHNDDNTLEELRPRIKELGWTPDTLLIYPAPDAYRLLVARLADKFAALNESNVMAVQKELVEANYAFNNFLKRDKSAWSRIDNVNQPTITDWL